MGRKIRNNSVLRYVLVITLVLAGMSGCLKTPTANAAAKKMKLSSKKVSLEVGQKKTIQVKNKKGKKVTWKSSKKKVAAVSKKGVITAKKAGKTTVKATVKLGNGKKKTLSCKVTVSNVKKTENNGNVKENPADTGSTETPSVNKEDLTPDKIYDRLIALKSQYPEGMSWDGNKSYQWKGGVYTGGAGCMAFAFLLSDAAFGSLPARMVDFSQISLSQVRVGDIIRYRNDTHAVVVLEVKENSFVVAEGNYNKSVHWGRTLSFEEVKQTGNYILTRYPD